MFDIVFILLGEVFPFSLLVLFCDCSDLSCLFVCRLQVITGERQRKQFLQKPGFHFSRTSQNHFKSIRITEFLQHLTANSAGRREICNFTIHSTDNCNRLKALAALTDRLEQSGSLRAVRCAIAGILDIAAV